MDMSVNCLSLDPTNLQGLDVFHLLRNSIQVQQLAGVNIYPTSSKELKICRGKKKRRGKD
jgi:hypothetical protein